VKGSMIVLIVILGLVALFTVQNPGVIHVRFLGFSGDTLLLAVIVAAFGAGVLGAGFAALPGYFRRRSETAALRRRNQELEAELSALKAKAASAGSGPTPPATEPPKAGGTA